jgi:two-component system, OmpR family, response regulator VicR
LTPLEETLTAREIAEYCKVHFRTVLRWIQRDELKAHQIPGRGDNRVLVADFLEFLRRHDLPVPPEFSILCSRVLIVEDSSQLARSMRRVLERSGLEVEVASDGFRAGVLLGTFRPAVVTLDLHLPGTSGLGVLAFLKDSPRFQKTRVLVVSGEGDSAVARALESGAEDFLSKPFLNSSLVQKVFRLLPQVGDETRRHNEHDVTNAVCANAAPAHSE